jgi:hypothetical protein
MVKHLMTKTHVMDAHPDRFGWRTWHLDETGTRLLSPLHKSGKVQAGTRVVESVCSHRPDPFVLSDCYCGIYYETGDGAALDRWLIEADRAGRENLVLTFGAAVGEVADDPVITEQGLRAPRYAILHILMQPGSAAAMKLRERYQTNITMKPITASALDHVRDTVRADLRPVEATEFFDSLRAEPVRPVAKHIVDRSPELFGWRAWRLDENGGLSDPLDPTQLIMQLRTPSGAAFFETLCHRGHKPPTVACPCGLSYIPGATYFCWFLDQLEQQRQNGDFGDGPTVFAATYGMAQDAIKSEYYLDVHRCRRHFPMAICIPSTHQHLKARMERHYGFAVIPELSPQVFQDVERLARTKLGGRR